MSDPQDDKTALGQACALYAELRISAGIDQAFRNGYRRCLMVFDPSFRPGHAADFESREAS